MLHRLTSDWWNTTATDEMTHWWSVTATDEMTHWWSVTDQRVDHFIYPLGSDNFS